MARKVFVHRLIVSGSGQFPVDMLRYDSCYPADTESAVAMISDHRDQNYLDMRDIELTSLSEKGWTPTVGRWNSFGWSVVNYEMRNCIND